MQLLVFVRHWIFLQHAQKCGLQHLFLMHDSGLSYSIELITGNSGVDVLFLPSLSAQKLSFEPAHIVRKKGSIVIGSELDTLHSSSIILPQRDTHYFRFYVWSWY